MGTANKIARISLIYLIGQLGSRFISLLMLPIYTNQLSPEAYGSFDVVTTYTGVIIPVLCIEVWSGMLRFALLSQDNRDRRRVVNNSLLFCFLGIGLFLLGFTPLGLLTSMEHMGYIGVYTVTTILMHVTSMSCRAFSENKLYAVSGMLSVFVNAAVSIVCIFGFHLGVETLYIAAIASNLAQILLVESRLHTLGRFRFSSYDKTIARDLLHFCLPLSIDSVFWFLLSSVNRIIINLCLPNGDHANGIYAAGNKLTVFITLLLSVFFMAWQETNYSELDRARRQQHYRLAYRHLVRLVGAGTILLLPFTKLFFPLLIGHEYAEAERLVPFLYLATYFQSINRFTATFFSIENKTRQLIISKIAGSAVNIAVIFLLLPSLGLVASALALIASQLTVVLLQYARYRRFTEVGFELKNILLVLGLFLVSGLIYFFGGTVGNLIWMAAATGLCLWLCRDFFVLLLAKLRRK